MPISSVKSQYESAIHTVDLISTTIHTIISIESVLSDQSMSVLLPKPPRAAALPSPACMQCEYSPWGCDLLVAASSLFDVGSRLQTPGASAAVVSSLHELSSVESTTQT
jgi:hypothetical protein